MSRSINPVKLKNLVFPVSRPIKVVTDETYTSLGVKWYANGLFVKEPLFGKDIKANQLFRVESGDFLYNRLFAWKGSFALAGAEHDGCFVSGEFPTFRVDESKLLAAYLMRYFSNPRVWDAIAKQSSGASQTSRLRFHEIDFLNWEIPLRPIPEQQQIVRMLGEADTLRQLRARADTRTNDFIPALFNEMFGDSGTNSKGWKKVTLGEIGGRGQYGLNAAAMSEGKGVRYIRITDIDSQGRLEGAEPAFVPTNIENLDKYELREDDILIARSGATAGKSYLHFELPFRAVYAGYLIRFQIDSKQVLPSFVARFLQTPDYWSQLNARKRAAAQPNVNARQLSSIRLPLPPLALQREFVTRVAEVGALQAQQARSRRRLEDLFQTLLHRAFSGELA